MSFSFDLLLKGGNLRHHVENDAEHHWVKKYLTKSCYYFEQGLKSFCNNSQKL